MGKGRAARSDFNPADYEVVGFFYCGNDEDMGWAYQGDHADLADRLEALGSDFMTALEDAGRCNSCGTIYAHGAVINGPDGLETIGGQCASEYYSLDSRVALRRKEATKRKEQRMKREEGQKFLNDKLPEVLDMLGRFEEPATEDDFEFRKLAGSEGRYAFDVWTDMVESARRYGSLTERQVDFAKKLVKDVHDEVEAARNALPVIAIPDHYLDGRVEIVGKVISQKVQESDYGPQFKMLLEVTHDGGTFRLWGTEPSSINPGRGDTVRLWATVEQSQRDETFGFYSRPTKAEVLNSGSEDNGEEVAA